MDDWFCFLTSHLNYHLSLITFFIPSLHYFCTLVWNFIHHHLPHPHLDPFFSLINVGELVLLSLPGHNPIPFLLNGQVPSGSPLLPHLPVCSVVYLRGFIFPMSSPSYHCLKITLLFTFWPQQDIALFYHPPQVSEEWALIHLPRPELDPFGICPISSISSCSLLSIVNSTYGDSWFQKPILMVLPDHSNGGVWILLPRRLLKGGTCLYSI